MPFFNTFSDTFKAGERPATAVNIVNIPNINIWYDASTPAYFSPSNPANGIALTQWTDKSVTGHNAGPSGGANKPTYATPVQNGFGAVQLNGSQNLQITNASSWLANLSGYTIYTVFKLTSTTGTPYLTVTDQGGSANYVLGGNLVTAAAGGTGTSTVAAETTKFHIIGQIFDGTLTGNANRLKLRYDLTPVALNFGATTVGTASSAANSKLNIGWDGSANNMTGYIAEVIMLTRAVNMLEVEALEAFLKSKWGL